MIKVSLRGLFVILILLAAVACGARDPLPPRITVYASGLLNPVGMTELPDGGVLVAEEGTGSDDLSAGVSLITPDGTVGRLISGLPSGRDSGDLSGVPFIKLSPDGNTLFTAHFDLGRLYTLPVPQRSTIPSQPFGPEDLGERMLPLNNVFLINPFDMTFDADGVPVVSDASGNGVARETDDGQTQFFHRFGKIETGWGPIDPVPTGIERIGAEYYVTLTGGCPYPAGSGRLVAVDESRNERLLIDGLNMPIDVALGPDDTLWVLEFARFRPDASCFSGMGYQQDSGRLSRMLPDGTLETVMEGLNFPTSLLPRNDGSLLISLLSDGQVVEVTFPEPERWWASVAENEGAERDRPVSLVPTPDPAAADRPAIPDPDAALRRAIAARGLQARPGSELREGATPLAELGRQLFFDPILSGDQNISCATCHHPAFGMGDGRPLSIGTGGEGLGPQREFVDVVTLGSEAESVTVGNPFIGAFIPRNSPTILNSALLPVQFWDGRVAGYAGAPVVTLEDQVNDRALTDALAVQALFPIASLHEMAGATLGDLPPEAIRRVLTERLAQIPFYATQFENLFGTPQPDITAVVTALAAFERRLIMTDTPWDAYLAGEDGALTEQQKQGALLFYGVSNPAVNCATCHSGDLFTDLQFYNLLVPQLGPGKGHGPEGRDDWGHAAVSFDARDRFSFRTAPLRNVAFTAPYFHSGAYATLTETVRHHANIVNSATSYDPGNHLPPSFFSSVRPFDPAEQLITAAPQLVNGLPLAEQEIADLAAFLNALSDPAAADLLHLVPEEVPSGLPIDPLPQPESPGQNDSVPASNVGADAGPLSPTVVRFTNVAATVGLDFTHGAFRTAIFDDPAAMMGAGLCWIDYDRDGWLDLYLVNSHAEDETDYWNAHGGLPTNALFRNQLGTFVDVTAGSSTGLAQRGNGCIAADFNRDGWSDLFITADGPNRLLWNQGDGTFVEGAAAAGLDAPEWNSTAAVTDINGDGWPDLFVAAYIDLENSIPNPSGAFPQDYYGLPDRLYLNLGNGTFRDVSYEAGLSRTERGLGALFTDLDNDGSPELYIANDGQPNRLYTVVRNDSAIGFRLDDLSLSAGIGDSGSGMGIAGGDYDGDARFDLFVTNWEAELNALYRNELDDRGELTFAYSTYRIGISGLGNNMTGWGTQVADFDQDGDADLLVANGRVPVSNFETDAELVRFYGNLLMEGRPGQFREWTRQAGLHDDGVGPLLARGSAMADYDNDGDLDVAINTIGGPPALLRNDSATGGWLQIDFDGFYPGATAEVELPDGRILVRELHVGSSYLASEDTRLHFGLGAAERVVRVTITVQGEIVEALDIPANTVLTVP